MKATVLIALAIAYHSAAAQDSCPTQPRHSADKQGIDSVVSQSANFDEFPEGTSGKPLGEYNQLYWTPEVITLEGSFGVKPQSLTGALKFDIASQLHQQPEVYANYTGSRTDFFHLNSFYFGCVGSITGLPESCSLEVTGYREGTKSASQTVQFNSSGVLASMSQATLESTVESDFATVDKVTFKIVGILDGLLLVVLLDSFSYDVYVKGNATGS